MSKSNTERPQSKVFGEVAELYHAVRPDYPDGLYNWMIETSSVNRHDLLLDIGCGTGKSSAPFLRRGFTVLGVEPDSMMARVALRELGDLDTFSIEQLPLDELRTIPSQASLVYAGQSWHWMNPETRFENVASLLNPDGWLCVFWNRPEQTQQSFDTEMDALYDELAPSFNAGSSKIRLPGLKAAIAADSPKDEFDLSGLFEPVHTYEESWEKVMSSDEHVQSLMTQSDHRMLPEESRIELFSRVQELIDNDGGRYKQRFTTHAYAARLSV